LPLALRFLFEGSTLPYLSWPHRHGQVYRWVLVIESLKVDCDVEDREVLQNLLALNLKRSNPR